MRISVVTCLISLTLLAPLEGQTGRQFEAASVRATPPGTPPYRPLDIDAVRFSARTATLRYLITQAYGIDDYQLMGTTGWMNGDYFTVAASIPTPSDHAQVMEMLRSLLAESFHLKSHFETRPTKVYELVVAKGGSKLEPLAEGDSGRPPSNSSPGQMTMSAGTTLPELVSFLNTRSGTAALGWPVVDHTGIQGRFKIWLTASLKSDPDGRSGTFDIDFPSELRRLGLELKPTRADCSFLVIDNAEKPEAP